MLDEYVLYMIYIINSEYVILNSNFRFKILTRIYFCAVLAMFHLELYIFMDFVIVQCYNDTTLKTII